MVASPFGGVGVNGCECRAGGSSYVSGAFMEYFRTDESGRVADTQERLTSRGFGFGGDDSNPFFQSWFGRPAFGPSGYGPGQGPYPGQGYPNQGGPYSNGAGSDIRRSPFGGIDDRPPPMRRVQPGDRQGF